MKDFQRVKMVRAWRVHVCMHIHSRSLAIVMGRIRRRMLQGQFNTREAQVVSLHS